MSVASPASTSPIYSDLGVDVYCGDAMEVLPTLERDSADLLVTDPPWGMMWESNYRTASFGQMDGDTSSDLGMAGIAACMRILKNCRHLYVFGKFDVSQFKIGAKADLIWDKGMMGMGNMTVPWGSQHEPIVFAVSVKHKGKAPAGGLAAKMRRGSVLKHQRPNSEQVRHPSEKPVLLIRELIESSSRHGEVVLDPFGGSGSTAIAAMIEGRRAIVIEKEPQWCDMIVSRCKETASIVHKLMAIR
jgi:DNA modification methylase